tara:strand:- start:608 stop:805 length:198 start_codon:yes stop_codon:yes gene_type:complete
MSFKKAISLIPKWPKDKNVPRLMKNIYNKSNDYDKIDIGRAIEALYAAAESETDINLISKSWSKQ